MITQQPSNSFAWTQDLLMRIIASIDWLMAQPIVMAILVAGAMIGLVQYAMGGSR